MFSRYFFHEVAKNNQIIGKLLVIRLNINLGRQIEHFLTIYAEITPERYGAGGLLATASAS